MAHGGFPEPQHNRKAPLARQVPSNYAVPDPIALTVSKALQAACPMHDTQGAGVVTEAHNPIVVA
jgi:hypothetical protein